MARVCDTLKMDNIMTNIPFLSLKDVTALHGAEIAAAVSRVTMPCESRSHHAAA